jgi:hypothetical protein
MFRKLVFGLILIAAMLVTSGSATTKGPKPPGWENVFTPPPSDFTALWALETFKNHLYVAADNYTTGVQIYRSADGKDWTPVNEAGFGDPGLWISWDMMTFKGKLYISVHDWGNGITPGGVWRSENGTDWERVFTLSDDDFATFHMPAAFGEFNGMLYFSSIGSLGSYGQLWRSPSGDPGTWEMVFSIYNGGFLAPLTAFKGYAYVSGLVVGEESEGMRVWRSADGVNWEVVGAGVLEGPENLQDGVLTVFRNQLYLSTQAVDGGRIYRTQDGVNWDAVVTGGFGDPMIAYINSMQVYQGDLYALCTADDGSGSTYARVYRSHTGNGNDWEQIPTDSWGAHSGLERMQQAVFKGDLYAIDFNFNNTPGVYKMVKGK